MVKAGYLQEPFSKIPPEGPLLQFQPPSIIKKSTSKSKLSKPQVEFVEPPMQLQRPSSGQQNQVKIEKFNDKIHKINEKIERTQNPLETKMTISTPKPNDDINRLRAQLEISQLNEKHLKEELLVILIQKKSKVVNDQNLVIEELKREVEFLRTRLDTSKNFRNYIYEAQDIAKFSPETEEAEFSSANDILSLENISDNIKRLEKLQEELSRGDKYF